MSHSSNGRRIHLKDVVTKEPRKIADSRVAAFAVAAGLLSLSALASAISQLNLAPVYGSIPSSLYHRTACLAVGVLAAITRGRLRRESSISFVSLLSLHAFSIPVISQWPLLRLGRLCDPELASVLTESFTCMPLLFLTLQAIASRLEGGGFLGGVSSQTCLLLLFLVLERFIGFMVSWIASRAPVFVNGGLHLLVASGYAAMQPSKLIVGMIPALYYSLQIDPHTPFTSNTLKLNSSLISAGYAMLDRRQSTTGYLSVLENVKEQYRVLRCDHSLLGGYWIPLNGQAQDGNFAREPIFSVFTMLEAVRLMESNEIPAAISPRHQAALVM